MNLQFVVGAYIVKDDFVLLVWHNKLKRWVPAGGVIDLNELPDEAVIREVKEETGLDVSIYPPIDRTGSDSAATPLHQPYRVQSLQVNGELKYIDLVYFCKSETFDLDVKTDEIAKARWFKLEELNSYSLFPHVRFLCEQALMFFMDPQEQEYSYDKTSCQSLPKDY